MTEKEFGAYINMLIAQVDLSLPEALACFTDIVCDGVSEMQQGAFLAALSAKGETAAEIAAIWQVIYEHDTIKVDVATAAPLVENCGSGMDAFKTFNISTAASLIAAADGVAMARHGSRAITSGCGTVDIAELLGVDVECPPKAVARSIETSGIGLFNGTSPLVHPKALGRILSRISFGSVLNTAASLANPARPLLAVRGVHRRDLVLPTAEAMREIGYDRALVVHGECDGADGLGIDEASTLGVTHVCELHEDGTLSETRIVPADLGIKPGDRAELATGPSGAREAERLRDLAGGGDSRPRRDIACLNAALILYVAGRQPSVAEGYERACALLGDGSPAAKLDEWVGAQQG
jgi:anthranilate phosphoribosyltransferase